MDKLIEFWRSVEQMPTGGKIFWSCVVFVCIFFLVTFCHRKRQSPGTGQEPE